MAEIRCALWNCSGILPTSSAKEKMDFLRTCTRSNLDVLILVETHHKFLQEISPLLHAYMRNSRVVHTGAQTGDPYAGIAVLVSSRLKVLDQTVLLPGRLLNLRIKGNSKTFNISVVYGYTSSNASQQKMKLVTDILAKHHKTNDNNIILGDFNFVENDLDRTNQNRSGKNQCDNVLARTWCDFTERLSLSDPFRARNPMRRAYSYIHTMAKSKSRLDRLYVNDENCNDILYYKHVPTHFIKAHKLVTFAIKEECERGPGF